MASHAYSGDDAVDSADEAEELWMIARKKKAPRAPSGTLRRVRRLLPAGGGAGWGGRRRREFLLWRERLADERRQARETARWSSVRVPPDLLAPAAFIEVDLADNAIIIHG